jgi:hypothetical protein
MNLSEFKFEPETVEPSTTAVEHLGLTRLDSEDYAHKKYITSLVGLPYDSVKGTDMEGDWHDVQGELRGSISKDERNVVQKAADDLYDSGILGASIAAAADILPGIPFVDILDPPSQLSDTQMQASRNLLGALSIPMMMKQTPKAIGRVVTNVREPYGYGGTLGMIRENVLFGAQGKGPSHASIEKYFAEPSKIKRVSGAIGKTLKSIVQDVPLYGSTLGRQMKTMPSNLAKALAGGETTTELQKRIHDVGVATDEAREYLYRITFGLKPRKGTNIFKKNKDGTLSFNPKSKRAKLLIEDIQSGVESRGGQFSLRERTYTPRHSVMGGFSAKVKNVELPPGYLDYRKVTKSMVRSESGPGRWMGREIHYEDIWNFKMNAGEWAEALSTPSKAMAAAQKGGAGMTPGGLKSEKIFSASLRSLVDAITESPVIKGTVPLH